MRGAKYALVGIAVVAALTLSGCGGGSDATPSAVTTTVAGSPVKVTGPLSYKVWSSVVRNFPDGIPTSNVLYATTQVEDHTDDTIRIYIQSNLTDAEQDRAARTLFNFNGFHDTDLQTVIVRDASGVDSNHYRHDFPYLDQ